MTSNARFAHVSITAKDWKKLAEFYVNVFGCEPAGPERHHHGEWTGNVAGVPGAEIRGRHFRLPGYGDGGPTLEIFQYNKSVEPPKKVSNLEGFAHIAFEVDDVEATRQQILEAGGGPVGELITREIPGTGTITLVYMTDPEGNIIELQNWS